jgi:TolB protein
VDIASGDEQTQALELSGMLDGVLSPDGQQIAFSLSTSGSVDDNNIWTVALEGQNLRKRTQLPAMQHEPAWSPNGERLYFLSGDGGQAHDIWMLTLATGEVRQLTVGALYHFDIAVGPQNTLAFSSNRSGNYEIWLWDEGAGGTPQKLTDHPALDARPSWSPSGESMVFESSRSGGLNIWKLELVSHALTQLTYHADGARHPVWSGSMGDEVSP